MRTLIAATLLGMFAVGCDETTAPTVLVPLTDAPNLHNGMGISDRIVFESDRNGNSQVFIMNGDGRSETGLTSSADFPTGARHPALSPTGSHIAFVSDGDIYVMLTSGSGGPATHLTNTAQNDEEVSWSPDGQKIVFSRQVSGGTHPNYEIFWVTLDASTEQQVTNDYGNLARDPVWHPNGLTIAFERADGIYEVDADCQNCSGGSILLPGARDLAFSPDGSQMAYVWEQAYKQGRELWVAVYGSSGLPTQVTTDDAVEGNPAWSPDGAQVTYDSDRYSEGWPKRDVWSVRLSDMRPVQLTFTGDDSVRPTWAIVPIPLVRTRR